MIVEGIFTEAPDLFASLGDDREKLDPRTLALAKEELRGKIETVTKNYNRKKAQMYLSSARCEGELTGNVFWEESYVPWTPKKKREGLGGALASSVQAIQEEYSQNLDFNKGPSVRQIFTIDPRQKPILDIPRVRRENAWVESVIKFREERAKEARKTPPPSEVSLGSDVHKMVRTRLTRRNMALIGRSALQRRQMENKEREVEDSEDDMGAEWDMNVDSDATSSESEQEDPRAGTIGQMLLG